jgi:phenol 2-monooxygenase
MDDVDVLIVGAGPAGLVLAAQLAAFPEIRTAVVERRDGPLRVGQADGVACRTVEMFEAFGLAGRLVEEAYWVNEVTFWRPDPEDGSRIVRTGRVRDTEEGLSEFPHVIVNQARMLELLRSAGGVEPVYGRALAGVSVDADGVTATLGEETIRAGYVVGCDGARSATREAIGLELRGDATDEVWGVMDVLAVTDFPDVRLKAAITSTEGNILIIPREGGFLTRFYIELESREGVTVERLAEAANRILSPYTLEVKDVVWWSVYEIGQRLCDRFDDSPESPRVFIAGDACHTHSAKAGQGMNVSMADAFNLGWKLAAVLRGTARPELLRTYSEERRAVAQELIEFDREFSRLFRGRSGPVDPEQFQRYFVAQGRFTAGVATHYAPSSITAGDALDVEGFPVGMRFHSAPVIRVADAKPVQLGHAARADGAWRVYVFAGPGGDAWPEPEGVDVLGVFQQRVAVEELPEVLLPRTGPLGLIDYGKAFFADPDDDIFDARGIPREGCLVLVRPDQYVAHVLALGAHRALDEFLSALR